MLMITTNNNFSGASFSYHNESNTCQASGEYRCEDNKLVSVNINGQYNADDKVYNFWASLDASGNVNISGVPAIILAGVAEEVAEIISEIEAILNPAE